MLLQCLPIKKKYGHAGYVDDPLLNSVYMAIWMPTCIVWLSRNKWSPATSGPPGPSVSAKIGPP